MSQKPTFFNRIRHLPIPILILSLSLIVLLLGMSAWFIISTTRNNTKSDEQVTVTIPTHGTTTPTKATPASTSVSPLIFGTNMGLFNANDQVLTSGPTRSALQQLHIRIVRIPTRQNFSTTVDLAAVQAIKDIGAVPLIALRGSQDPNVAKVLADDTRMISAVNQVFGTSTVYYEFGNEDDLNGVSIDNYTQRWNAVVPQLKHLAPNGIFIGPVSYQYDHDNLTAFLQNAQPHPDMISWHEYTCSLKDPADKCLAGIDKWTDHISDARASLQNTLGKVLPIMITEWNYAPDQTIQSNGLPIDDGKYNNTQFMKSWTTKALQILAANRIFASMQYSCTNTAIPLVNNNSSITVQGTTLQAIYEQMIIKGQQPAPLAGALQNPSGTAATKTTVNGPSAFTFEDGTTNGWNMHGQGITGLQNSSTVAVDGTHSLQLTLSNSSSKDFPYIAASTSTLANAPHMGQTITLYMYLASNSVDITAKPFVTDKNYQWSMGNITPLTPGTWTKLTFVIPANLSSQPSLIGVQLNNPNGSNIPCIVYLDAVSWS